MDRNPFAHKSLRLFERVASQPPQWVVVRTSVILREKMSGHTGRIIHGRASCKSDSCGGTRQARRHQPEPDSVRCRPAVTTGSGLSGYITVDSAKRSDNRAETDLRSFSTRICRGRMSALLVGFRPLRFAFLLIARWVKQSADVPDVDFKNSSRRGKRSLGIDNLLNVLCDLGVPLLLGQV